MTVDGDQSGGGGRWWRRALAGVATGFTGCLVVVALLLKHEPAFVRATAFDPDTERAAARMVTKGAALHAAIGRAGSWGAAVSDSELNAWLATDLPRNHAAALPAGLSAPRVCLEPGRIRVAARTAFGPLAATASLAVEVRLRAAGRLECAVTEARLGAIPVPAGPFVHRLAALLGRLGLTTETRRLDGRSVIVVSLGGRGRVLRGLSVDAGELVVAGTTEEVR